MVDPVANGLETWLAHEEVREDVLEILVEAVEEGVDDLELEEETGVMLLRYGVSRR